MALVRLLSRLNDTARRQLPGGLRLILFRLTQYGLGAAGIGRERGIVEDQLSGARQGSASNRLRSGI
jgi:hypothetical protein